MIFRAACFSPNSVEADKAILTAVAAELEQSGVEVTFIAEENLPQYQAQIQPQDVVFTMSRSNAALDCLKILQQRGTRVINNPEGIEQCSRSRLFNMLSQNGFPVPPEDSERGCWLKRGDQAAQAESDVVFCSDTEKLNEAIALFRQNGIEDYIIQKHIEGDLLKFYGVHSVDFFEVYYPTDDGIAKFQHEKINGKAHHYAFDSHLFHDDCMAISRLTDVDVFGGDAIITPSGKWFFIDFNDWPSFRRCRLEAAKAIKTLYDEENRK